MLETDNSLFDVPSSNLQAPVEVHPTAIVAPGAQLGRGVKIGPYSIIGPKVTIGDNVHIGPHVTVENRTTIGARTIVYQFATLGVVPQDLKFHGEDAELIIGEENSIRQYVNISIGSDSGGGVTRIGRRNLLMVYCHIAHDCQVGDNIVIVNGVALAGHVIIQDRAFIGGLSAVHQFCRIGTRAMIGGGSMVVQDVPPYCMVQGDRAAPVGLNVVGLRRAGFSTEILRDLKTMYRLLYSEGLTLDDSIARIETQTEDSLERRTFVEFLRKSARGVCR
jgi:UDP-N-acetylglucosamine acyltransferase